MLQVYRMYVCTMYLLYIYYIPKGSSCPKTPIHSYSHTIPNSIIQWQNHKFQNIKFLDLGFIQTKKDSKYEFRIKLILGIFTLIFTLLRQVSKQVCVFTISEPNSKSGPMCIASAHSGAQLDGSFLNYVDKKRQVGTQVVLQMPIQ